MGLLGHWAKLKILNNFYSRSRFACDLPLANSHDNPAL